MAPYRSILFVERTPTQSMHAVTCAAVLARAQGAGLTVAGYVGSGPAALSSDGLAEDESRMCRWWARRVEDLSGVGDLHGVATSSTLLRGDFQTVVNEQVREGGHDLVVVVRESSRGVWPLRAHWTDRRLLRDTDASVLFLAPRQAASFSHILAAIDVATDEDLGLSRELAGRAVELARGLESEIELIHAWSLIGETVLASRRRGVSPTRLAELREAERSRRLERLRELIEPPPDLEVHISIPHGAAGRTVERRAIEWGADLIVVGRPHASAVESLFLGTLSEYLLGRIPAAILVVHPRESALQERPAADEPSHRATRKLEPAS